MSDFSLANLSVLVVEPSQMQRRVIADELYKTGIVNITEVDKGEHALERISFGDIDLIVSALYLPDMTGSELILKIRNNPDMDEIAFILISSETRFEYLDPVKQAGAVSILSKPFKTNELMMALNTTLKLFDAQSLPEGVYAPEELHVLLVDDSPLARRHIRRVLSNMGIEKFTEAENGIEALQQLQGQLFDLVVTDYNMPLMDGSALVDKIRNESNQPSIPIMMVTSEQNENRLAAVQQSGVSAICDKPFELETVQQLMKQVLANTA